MGNSSRTLQSVVDFAVAHPDIVGLNPAAGWSNLAVRVGNKVMADLLNQQFNFKFNRIAPPLAPLYTNNWQQDYALIQPASPFASIKNVGWLEDCRAIDVNATQFPPGKFEVEVVKELPEIGPNLQRKKPAICWLPNDQLQYSTWGGNAAVTSNPQPNQVIAPLLGATAMPKNPWLQIKDTNGNLLVLAQFGTTGGTTPSFPSAGAAAGVTVNDGTCIWVVIDPKGQGIRLVPLPAQGGRVWQLNIIAQAKPAILGKIGDVIDPIPDDQASYFEDGFIARCYEFSPEPAKQATWQKRWAQWIQGIATMLKGQAHEPLAFGMYPDRHILDDGYTFGNLGPAWPYGGWWER